MSEWAKELLAHVARDAERTLWPNGSAEWQAQVRILAVLERRLLGLLEAGEASNDMIESAVVHVSHAGPTLEEAEKVLEQYRAAKANTVRP